MAVIEKKVLLAGSKGQERVIAQFNSGASYSFITPELAEKIEVVVPLPKPIELGTAKQGEKLIATHRITIDFHLNGYRFSDEFLLVPQLSEPVIIGAKTMQAWRLKLDLENDEVIIDPRVTKLRLLILSLYRFIAQIKGTKAKKINKKNR